MAAQVILVHLVHVRVVVSQHKRRFGTNSFGTPFFVSRETYRQAKAEPTATCVATDDIDNTLMYEKFFYTCSRDPAIDRLRA